MASPCRSRVCRSWCQSASMKSQRGWRPRHRSAFGCFCAMKRGSRKAPSNVLPTNLFARSGLCIRTKSDGGLAVTEVHLIDNRNATVSAEQDLIMLWLVGKLLQFTVGRRHGLAALHHLHQAS